MVHRREVDSQPIILGNHGALWGNAMTLWDHDTGSVWSQPLGEAILGPRKGKTLELLPSTLTTWADWQTLHPDTFALAVASSPRGFELSQMSIVAQFGDVSASFPVPVIRDPGVVNADVGGEPIAIVVEPGTDNWTVFSRRLDDRVVELAIDGDELVELDGPGRWDTSLGLSKADSVEQLAVLPGFTSFQYDYWTFFPEGQVWDGERLAPNPDR